MKRALAGLLTVVLMGLVAWSSVRRPSATVDDRVDRRAAEAHPAEIRIRRLLDCAWNGDVTGYLASFDGPIRDRLGREVEERGRDAFAADLRRAARSRKSHAVYAVEPEGDRVARLIVETAYPDRNERQTYRLDDGPGGWLVTDVETIRSHQPEARYGSPAVDREPEGVPAPNVGLSIETGDDVPERRAEP